MVMASGRSLRAMIVGAVVMGAGLRGRMVRGRLALSFDGDGGLDWRLAEDLGEAKGQQRGDHSGDHAAQKQISDHGRILQWQGKPSRWRASWTNSCTWLPAISDTAPCSAPTK